MFELTHNSQCISCAICMDVCRPRAIDLRTSTTVGIEGRSLMLAGLQGERNIEKPPRPLMTFPYLSAPQSCNGCLDCVKQCPTSALQIRQT